MEDLIQALLIFSKYIDVKERWPTHCEHDIMMIMNIAEESILSEEDNKEVVRLGFHWSDEHDCWASYRFGSA